MKINVESHKGIATDITDESGKPIRGIISADIRIRPNAPIEAEMTIWIEPLHKLGAQATFLAMDPRTGIARPVSRIVFADGTDDWTAEEKTDG